MELNKRQDRFLVAAFNAAPSHGLPFSWERVGIAAQFDASESFDIAQQLTAKGLMTMSGDVGHLTVDGREEARVAKSFQNEIEVDTYQLGLIGKAYANSDHSGEFVAHIVTESENEQKWFQDSGLATRGSTFGHLRWTAAGLDAIHRLVEFRTKQSGRDESARR